MVTRLSAPERRRQLLDVAMARFAERGFHATSMEEIAEAAGVTKPVLYQHFSSKRELFQCLVDDVGFQLGEAITDAVAAAAHAGPHAQVEAGFGAYVAFVGGHQAAFRLLFGDATRLDEEFADVTRRIEDTLAELVAGLIDADIDDHHRHVAAQAIVGMAEGVARHWIREQPPVELAVIARQLADLAWSGLRGL